jgi:hypothetical protein
MMFSRERQKYVLKSARSNFQEFTAQNIIGSFGLPKQLIAKNNKLQRQSALICAYCFYHHFTAGSGDVKGK